MNEHKDNDSGFLGELLGNLILVGIIAGSLAVALFGFKALMAS